MEDLLARILKSMEVGQATSPSLHGTVVGYETEVLIKEHRLRRSMFYGRPRSRNCEPQLLWEVSLWEKIFPSMKPPEEEISRWLTILEPVAPQPTRTPSKEVDQRGQEGSTKEGRGAAPGNGKARASTILTIPEETPEERAAAS
eukprot:13117822-Heterocapsa_arctica.AAC.1